MEETNLKSCVIHIYDGQIKEMIKFTNLKARLDEIKKHFTCEECGQFECECDD